jgi:ABC-type transport system involved in multi-copper enzyme maturation permease subunit
MITSARAEVLRLAKWPTTWIITGVWCVLNLVFGYVFAYVSYNDAASQGRRSAPALLAQLNLDAVPVTLVQGLPMFGGALVLVMGALATGSGYGWGTWKTVLGQGPGRRTVLSGTLLALAAWLVGVVAVTLLLDFVASAVVMTLVGQPLVWPSLLAVVKGYGASLLIAAMWTSFGSVVGVITRSPALAVGLGLVWSLVLENLLRAVASALPALGAVTDHFPGTAAGSLGGALGASPISAEGGTPGILTVLGGTEATSLLLAYAMLFVGGLVTVVSRRDV